MFPPSPLSGLHLAVLHSQQEALKSLTQVVSVLPGQEVLNMRNHLYQVGNPEGNKESGIFLSREQAQSLTSLSMYPRLLCTWP